MVSWAMSDFQKGTFLLFLSELTDAEIQDAPDEVKNIYPEFRQCTDRILELTIEAIELADAYLNTIFCHRIIVMMLVILQ